MIENEQVYECQKCGRLISEKDVGSVKVGDYYRLYCPFCQSGRIRVVGEEEDE